VSLFLRFLHKIAIHCSLYFLPTNLPVFLAGSIVFGTNRQYCTNFDRLLFENAIKSL